VIEIHSKGGSVLKTNFAELASSATPPSPMVRSRAAVCRRNISAEIVVLRCFLLRAAPYRTLACLCLRAAPPPANGGFTHEHQRLHGYRKLLRLPALGIAQDAVTSRQRFLDELFPRCLRVCARKAHIETGSVGACRIQGRDATLAPAHALDNDQNCYAWLVSMRRISICTRCLFRHPNDTGLCDPTRKRA